MRRSARRLAVLLVLLAGGAGGTSCKRGLDAQGQAMLAPERAEKLRPEALVAHLGLRPGDVVADIGAGPGLLTLPLARAVPQGKVIATDINRAYLEALGERARRAGLGNVETRLVEPRAPGLAPASVDLALLCQVDHVLEDRSAYFGALVRALRPGGRIAIVNQAPHLRAARAFARAAGLVELETWAPSESYFLLMLRPGP